MNSRISYQIYNQHCIQSFDIFSTIKIIKKCLIKKYLLVRLAYVSGKITTSRNSKESIRQSPLELSPKLSSAYCNYCKHSMLKYTKTEFLNSMPTIYSITESLYCKRILAIWKKYAAKECIQMTWYKAKRISFQLILVSNHNPTRAITSQHLWKDLFVRLKNYASYPSIVSKRQSQIQ